MGFFAYYKRFMKIVVIIIFDDVTINQEWAISVVGRAQSANLKLCCMALTFAWRMKKVTDV